MPVGYPSWFQALGVVPLEAGDEISSAYLEDIRKFIACATIQLAGRIDEDTYFPSYDITQYKAFWDAEAPLYPNYRNYSGYWIFRYYGEFYILTVRDWYKTHTEMAQVSNYPTNESDNINIAPIVSHEDAIINSCWKKWACSNYFSHWDHNSDRYRIIHNGIISDITEEPSWHFNDCILPAHRYVPFDTKPGSHPPLGAEIRREHHMQKLRTCWQRQEIGFDGAEAHEAYHPTEISIEKPEPYDKDASNQVFHAPYLSDADTLECVAFQNAVALWSDYLGFTCLKKITSSSDWQEWWARSKATEFVLNDEGFAGTIKYPNGGTPANTKYLCIKDYAGGLGILLTDEEYYSTDFYQPDRWFVVTQYVQPMWIPYGDDWLGANASGFEAMLADFGTYDWYWCSAADGNHPAWLEWYAKHRTGDPPYLPAPIGCWRRMFRITMGKPKNSSGVELEDWKIWPGTEGDPPGYSLNQLMVTQAQYDELPAGDKWKYCVAPTESGIQTAWNALDEEVKNDCIARHGPSAIRHYTDASGAHEQPLYEAKHQMVNDLWGVLRYWQYFEVTDALTMTSMPFYEAYQEYVLQDGHPFSSPEELRSSVETLTWHPWLAAPWTPDTEYTAGDYVSATCPGAANTGGFDEFVFGGNATFKCNSNHTSSSSFHADWLETVPRLWDYWPTLPEFGTEATHGGATHYVNPSHFVMGESHGYWYEDGDENEWVKCGYSVMWDGNDEVPPIENTAWAAGLGVSPGTLSWPRIIRGAVKMEFEAWDPKNWYWEDSFRTRLNAIKNLKLRCVYRPVIVSLPEEDGCKLGIDGGYVDTIPVETEAEQFAATKCEYMNFALNEEVGGKYHALFAVEILDPWPWDLIDEWVTVGGGYANRLTEVCMDLGLTASLGAIVEMDWDKFEDFVNA